MPIASPIRQSWHGRSTHADDPLGVLPVELLEHGLAAASSPSTAATLIRRSGESCRDDQRGCSKRHTLLGRLPGDPTWNSWGYRAASRASRRRRVGVFGGSCGSTLSRPTPDAPGSRQGARAARHRAAASSELLWFYQEGATEETSLPESRGRTASRRATLARAGRHDEDLSSSAGGPSRRGPPVGSGGEGSHGALRYLAAGAHSTSPI